ncbi:37_t:CDS:10 [Gigaspora margarita]|uniref:37_t:CDS:1 n=1 Tax=Gigaspora margarita TaxID=4874 RepID=A0ABN7UAX5_GIGMA|nr:37_t:CDS:10 [Gigaspora margarita]
MVKEVMKWLESNEFASLIDANFLAASQTSGYSKVHRQSQVMGWFWWTREQKIEKYSIENLKKEYSSFHYSNESRIHVIVTTKINKKYIKDIFTINASKNGGNDEEMIETMKEITQILIWGMKRPVVCDQNKPAIVEYSEATKFFNSDESMVRAAVRTVTLNIFAVNDEQMQDFILDRNAAPYFSNLTYFIANHASILNDIITSPTYYKQYSKFNYYIAEHCDNFYYINDIINLSNEKMNTVLTTRLMDLLLQPIYADSLVDKKLLPSQQRIRINSVVALALLCHVLHIFRYPPLVTDMIAMLFSNSPAMMDYSCSPPTRFERPNPSFRRNLYREAIMGFLVPNTSAEHPDLNTLPALCLLYMSCRNHAIAPDVLIATDMYPQKLLKSRRLLDTLISDSDEYFPDDTSLSESRQSFDTESIMSNSTSASQVKPLFIDGNDESQFNVPSYKSVRGLFIDDDDSPHYGSVSIPSIKITNDDVNNHVSHHTRNYREELIRLILALLCQHYHLCRPMTLQMAVEVLLELLYYNGSGGCLTLDQIELMTRAENEIQELLKAYSSVNGEFPLNETEKAVADSMFGGDKYVGDIIMSAKLLFPPPIEANKEKQKIVDGNDAAKYIKILHLLRQARMLLSRQ